MVSAVSGLPAIVIDGFRELEKDFDLTNNRQSNVGINAPVNKKDATEKISDTLKKSDSKNEVNFEDFSNKLKNFLKDGNLQVEFSIDKELNKLVMKVINNETKEVIRQIPPDITLKIARMVTSILGNGQLTNATV
jgi:flagellar protein FlaG